MKPLAVVALSIISLYADPITLTPISQTNDTSGVNYSVTVPSDWGQGNWISSQPDPSNPHFGVGQIVRFYFSYEDPAAEDKFVSVLTSVNAIGFFNGVQIFNNIGLPGEYTLPNQNQPFIANLTDMWQDGINTLEVAVQHYNGDPLAISVDAYAVQPAIPVQPTPEPASLLLMGSAIVACGICRKRDWK